MNTNNMTSQELYALAKQRELEEKPVRPDVILPNNCDSNIELINLAKSYMDDEEAGYEVDTQFAYEALMEIVFGKDVFTYINNLGK